MLYLYQGKGMTQKYKKGRFLQMAKTNKQLIKLGLTQAELLELVEAEMEELIDYAVISKPEWGGDDSQTWIEFTDHTERVWNVYYTDKEMTDTLFVNSYRGEELDCVNAKELKSVTAVVNHIRRVIGE